MGAQQSSAARIPSMQQQPQTQQQRSSAAIGGTKEATAPAAAAAAGGQQQQSELGNKHGSITSLAAHHAAQKLAQMQAAGQTSLGEGKGSAALAGGSSQKTSRSGSFSSGTTQPQGPFEAQTQIKQDANLNQAAAAAASGQARAFPARPVSHRGHMLPQSAQMISEKERQREAEMEHIFTPQPGQIIAERCQEQHEQA